MGYTELGNWVYYFYFNGVEYFDETSVNEINSVLRDNGFSSIGV